MIIITPSLLAAMIPKNKNIDSWCIALNKILPKYNINTINRIAAFISQTAHESADFTVLTENLNYSAQGLANTWPNRYAVNPSVKPLTPNILASNIQRKPESIANITYANRMGNGDQHSGDGWKYRGRGLIQITGKDRYSQFAAYAKINFSDVITYVETPEGAIESACWFWNAKSLNSLADTQNIEALTKAINGGLNGLNDRTIKYLRFKTLLEQVKS